MVELRVPSSAEDEPADVSIVVRDGSPEPIQTDGVDGPCNGIDVPG